MNPNGPYFILEFSVSVDEVWRLRNSVEFNSLKVFILVNIIEQIQGGCLTGEVHVCFEFGDDIIIRKDRD